VKVLISLNSADVISAEDFKAYKILKRCITECNNSEAKKEAKDILDRKLKGIGLFMAIATFMKLYQYQSSTKLPHDIYMDLVEYINENGHKYKSF